MWANPQAGWPRLFQNLRSSAETELASKYPLHVATYWIGNTARIAERHYLQVPGSFYDQAVERDVQNAAHDVQNEAQQPIAVGCRGTHENPSEGGKNADSRRSAKDCEGLQSAPMETKGIEPSFRRCDRRVLPLHHVPRDRKSHFMFYRLDVNR